MLGAAGRYDGSVIYYPTWVMSEHDCRIGVACGAFWMPGGETPCHEGVSSQNSPINATLFKRSYAPSFGGDDVRSTMPMPKGLVGSDGWKYDMNINSF